MELGIPKKLAHIWIGPRPAPVEWMRTWTEKHPDWSYTLYDNDFLTSHNFRTRHLIDAYLKRKRYEGVADLMRYEILYENGGLIPSSDSICIKETDSLFPFACPYTVYENEFIRGKLVCPIIACPPKDSFVGSLISALEAVNPNDLDKPWKSTGNLFVARMIERLQPEIVIFPSYYFIPIHVTGIKYEGDGTIYAKEMFGSTRDGYPKRGISSFLNKLNRRITGNTFPEGKTSPKYAEFNKNIFHID